MLLDTFSNLPIIETERLILRKLLYSDKEDIFYYASKPEVAKYTLWYPHQSKVDTLEFLNIVYEGYRTNTPAPWGIELKAISKIIGTVGFVDWDKNNHKAEIGYALSQDYWNKGITTEAVRKVINFGFNKMELNRIEARCKRENVSSSRVLVKLGFTFEGILREQMLVKGKFEDMMIYSLLAKENKNN